MNLADEEIASRGTKERYHLNCKVVSKTTSFQDLQSRGKTSNETAEVILLIPQSSTETDCFYSAWLPPKLSPEEVQDISRTGQNGFNEVVMEAGYPILGYFRGAVSWASKYADRPHIFVMTKKAEEKLKSYIGKTLKLTVLGEGEEEALYEEKAETRSPISGIT